MNPSLFALAALFAVIAFVVTLLGNKLARFHVVSIALWVAVGLLILAGIFSRGT